MRPAAMFAAAFALGLTAVPTLGLADSGGKDDTATCPRGEVYDSRQRKCVKVQGSVLPDKVLTDYAAALSKAGRYDEALAILDLLRKPNTAEALNYRGYATRKLGQLDEGIGYYLKSVALDPQYTLVREYLGEAYVIKGDMASAKAQLQVIQRLCGTDCEQYQHLASAIADPSKM
jgi:tetratricopeptide (TPR) repeat protein